MARRIRLDKKIRLVISLVVLILLFAGLGSGWPGQESSDSSNSDSQPKTSQLKNEDEVTPDIKITVTRFVDGDTFSVTLNGKKETVRIIGLDTPETHRPNTPVQCYGPAASAYLKNLVGGQTVTLKSDRLNDDRDKYDRLLRHVYLPDGRSVAKESVRNGYGFAYTKFPFTGKADFVAAEKDAEKNARGLWAACEITERNGVKQTNNVN